MSSFSTRLWAATAVVLGLLVLWTIFIGTIAAMTSLLSIVSILYGLLKTWMFSIFLGVSFGVFTWMITYVDSQCPGVNPPTPMSAWRFRKPSGHTFHVGYILAFANGFMIFLTSALYASGHL